MAYILDDDDDDNLGLLETSHVRIITVPPCTKEMLFHQAYTVT